MRATISAYQLVILLYFSSLAGLPPLWDMAWWTLAKPSQVGLSPPVLPPPSQLMLIEATRVRSQAKARATMSCMLANSAGASEVGLPGSLGTAGLNVAAA